MVTCTLGDKKFSVDFISGRALREMEPASKMYGRLVALSKAAVEGQEQHVHDIAVDPVWAGHGLAARLLAEVLDAGRRLSLARAMLVAVQGADVYWARHGFVAQAAPMAVMGFGEGAVWMVRDL